MNGADWYPTEYPERNFKGAIEAVKDFPGLKVSFSEGGVYANIHAYIRTAFGLSFEFDREQHLISFIRFEGAAKDVELFVDPYSYAGNGVPPTFNAFIREALKELNIASSQTEEDEDLRDTLSRVDSALHMSRDILARFEQFYELFLGELYRPIGHHELYTEPYEEGLSLEITKLEESAIRENVEMIDYSGVTEDEFSAAIQRFMEENPTEAASSNPVSKADWQDLYFHWISSGYSPIYLRGSAIGSFSLSLTWNKHWGIKTSTYTGGAFKVILYTSRAKVEEWFTDRHLPGDLKAHWQDWAAKHQPTIGGIHYRQTDHIKRVTRKQWAEAQVVWDKILASLKPVQHHELYTRGYEESVDEALMLRLKENGEEEYNSPYLTKEEIEEVLERAEEAGITFTWDHEQYADLSWMDEEERQEVEEVLWCLARNENTGQSASLGEIVDPSQQYAREIEADLAMELGIERPHRAAKHHEIYGEPEPYAECLLKNENKEELWTKINDLLAPLGFEKTYNRENAWDKEINFKVKRRHSWAPPGEKPGSYLTDEHLRLHFDFRNDDELTVRLSGLNKSGGISFDFKTDKVWLHGVPFDFNKLADFAYFTKIVGQTSGTNAVENLKKICTSLPRYYKPAYKEVYRSYNAAMDEILNAVRPTVKHHELYTEPYEETLNLDRKVMAPLALKEANVYVPEGTETIDLKSVPEEEVKRAYDKWVARGMPNKNYGYKPGRYAIFARAAKWKEFEMEVSIDLCHVVEIRVYLYPPKGGSLSFIASVDTHETPVEVDLILQALLANAEYRLIDEPEYLEALKAGVTETWPEWIALWRPIQHHELYTEPYEEARQPKPPRETIDATPHVIDYETAKALEDKLKELNYFDFVMARYGQIEVNKYFYPVNRYDWYAENFKEAKLEIEIGRDRRYNLPNIIGIETSVYGGYSEKAKAKRPSSWGSYGYQKARKLFPASAVPMHWPGPTCLAPSLDPGLRARLNDLCAEAYDQFIRALIPRVKHHELYTEPYEEARSREWGLGRGRRPTIYRPPKGGLPRLTAEREEGEETHREDYNKILYKLTRAETGKGEKSWEIKIGNARIFAPRISFGVRVIAKAASENPYEGEEVRPLVGPPFYSLGIRLFVQPARGNTISVYVLRHFDAAGYLAWKKHSTNLASPFIFCPMGDLKNMEARAFGEADPVSEGYFFAMASGSVADCLSPEDLERRMNLWKLFHPYILELAQRPEVRELEKPLIPTKHHELYGDVGGYGESLVQKAVIKTSYEVVTPESAERGDYEETGWIDEKGHDCEPDEIDREEGLDRVDLAAKFLEKEGARFIQDDLYEGDPDPDYETGAETTRDYHLSGFSEDELEDIRLLMKGEERPKRTPPHHELYSDVSYGEGTEPSSV